MSKNKLEKLTSTRSLSKVESKVLSRKDSNLHPRKDSKVDSRVLLRKDSKHVKRQESRFESVVRHLSKTRSLLQRPSFQAPKAFGNTVSKSFGNSK